MLKMKRGIAACLLLLMTGLPMLASADVIGFTIIIKSPGGYSEIRTINVSDMISIGEFEEAVRTAFGVKFSTGVDGALPLAGIYPSGGIFHLTRDRYPGSRPNQVYSYSYPALSR